MKNLFLCSSPRSHSSKQARKATRRNRTTPAPLATSIAAVVAASMIAGIGANAATYTWTAATGNWSAPGSWQGSSQPTLPTDTINVNGADTITMDVSASILGISNTSAGSTTVSGTGILTLGNNGTTGPGGTAGQNLTLNAPMIIGGTAYTFFSGGGSALTIGGSITGNATTPSTVTFNFANNANLTWSGNIANGAGGALGLAINTNDVQSHTLTLSGSNTFTGGIVLSNTSVTGSKLSLSGSYALGSGTLTLNSNVKLDVASAFVNAYNTPQAWNGDFFFGAGATANFGTGAITLSANRTISVTGNNAVTYGGVIGDNGSGYGLTLGTVNNNAPSASSSVIFTGSNTYTGPTTVNAGTLTLAGASGLLTGSSVTMNPGSTLKWDNSAGVLGSRLASSGTVTLNGATLTNAIPAAANNVENVGNLVLGGTAASYLYNNAAASGFNGMLTLGSVTRGAGSTLQTNLAFTGTTTNNRGVVVVQNAPALVGGILPWMFDNNAAWFGTVLTVSGTNYFGSSNMTGGPVITSTFGGNPSTDNVKFGATANNAGAVLAADDTVNSMVVATSASFNTMNLANHKLSVGTGALAFTANNNFTVQNGALTTGALSQELIVYTQSALANTVTISGSITDNGSPVSLTKSGGGTLILAGSNTYTGATVLNSGSTSISGVVGNGAITVSYSNLNGTSNGQLGITGTVGNGGITLNPGASVNVGTTGLVGGNITLIDSLGTIYPSATVSGSVVGGITAGNGSTVTLASTANVGGGIAFGNSGIASTLSVATGATVSGAITSGSNTNITQSSGGQLALTLGSGTSNFTTVTAAASGTLTLNSQSNSIATITTLTGTNTSGFVYNGNATSSLTLGNSIAGMSLKFASGNTSFNTPISTSNFEIDGGMFALNSLDRLQLAQANQTFLLTGGTANLNTTSYGFRLGIGNSTTQTGAAAVTGSQNGGSLITNQFNMGGTDTTAVKSPSYTLSGGTMTVNGAVSLGADTGGVGSATFNLTGSGKLVTNNTLSGAQASSARQVFNFAGGTLAANTIQTANLSGTAAASMGTLWNTGGTLAPGDIGKSGLTTITGTYNQASSGTLAIDLGGTAVSTAFQDSGLGKYDKLTVSGSASLAGGLTINILPGFAPAANNFTILSSGTLSASSGAGAFQAGSPQTVATTEGFSSMTVTTTSGAGGTVVLGGYSITNQWQGGGNWGSGAAGVWTTGSGTGTDPNGLAQGAYFGTFGGAGGTVTLDAARTIGTLAFNNSGNPYTLVASGAGALTLQSNNTSVALSDINGSNTLALPITLNSGLTVAVTNATDRLAMTGNISGGSNAISMSGSGTLLLSGTNTFGSVTINGGMLQASGTASMPSYKTAGLITVNSGGTLAVNAGGTGEFSAANITTLLGNATFASGGLLGIDTSNAGGSLTYSPAITGNLGVTKLGTGTLILGAASTYGGATTINNGTVQLSGSGSATTNPLGLGTLTVGVNGTLDLGGYTLANAKALAVNGALTNSGVAAVYSGTVTLGQLSSIGGSGDITLSSPIAGSNTWSKTGSDTLTLTGSSARSGGGTVINAGVLQLNANNALGSAGLLVTMSGGSLAVGNSAAVTLGGASLTTSGTVSLGTAASLTLGAVTNNSSTLTLTGAGNFAQTGVWGNGSGGIVLDGNYTGTATFNQANTFTGGLTVKSGSAVGTTGSNAFGASTITLGDTAGTASATLLGDARTFPNPITIQAGTSGSLTLGNTGAVSTTFSGPVALNNNLTLSTQGAGVLALTGVVTGSKTITTNSGPSGYVTLQGANTAFTGTVLVNTGFVKANTGNSFTNATVQVNSGATFDLNGQTNTVAGLNDVAGAGGTVTNSSTSSRILTVGGTGSYSFNGLLSGSNFGITAALNPSATQTLGAANTYTGLTTVNNGTLEFKNTSNASLTQTLGALAVGTVANSDATLKLTNSGTGTFTTTFASESGGATIGRVNGSSVNVVTSAGASVGFAAISGSGWIPGVFFNGANYAYLDGMTNTLRAPVYGTDAGFAIAGGTTAMASGSNNLVTSTLTNNVTYNSAASTINFSGPGAIDMNLGSGGLLNFNSVTGCGILRSGGGSTTVSGSNGARFHQSGSNWEYVFRTDTVADSLTINIQIDDNHNNSTGNTITKSGLGTLTLGGSNLYIGPTYVNEGTLVVANVNAIQNSQLLSPAVGGTVNFANGITTLTTGALGGGGTINLTNLGSGAVTLNTGNSNGATQNNSGTFSGTLSGSGTLNHYGSGIQTFLGATLASADAINVITGAVAFQNVLGGYSPNVGAVSLNGVDAGLQANYGSGTGNLNVTLPSLTARTAGSTRIFDVIGGTNGTTNKIAITGQATGVFGQGTFFGTAATGAIGNNYAWYDATGYVRGINYGIDGGSSNAAGGATLSGTYVQTTGPVTAQSTAQFTTLQISGSNNFTLDSGAGAVLTTNGILKSGNNAATISGGAALQAATDAELVIRADQSGDALTIATPIVANGNNALTKSGAGSVILTGSNSYTGVTTVNAGTLQIGDNTATPVVFAGGFYTQRGTTLAFNTTTSGTIGGNVSVIGTLANSNTSGIITVNQHAGYSGTINTIGGVSGATVVLGGDPTSSTTIVNILNTPGMNVNFTGGTWTLNGSGIYGSNLIVTGGTVQTLVGAAQNFYEVASLTVHGGYFNDQAQFGLRMGNQFGASSPATNNFSGVQDGGLVYVANQFELGGNSGTYAANYTLSSGTLSTTCNVNIAANATSGGQTTLALSGGKLLTSLTIQGSQGTGAMQAFVWTGGVLAANAYNATNLVSDIGVAVAATTNTLTNSGGTLAPGDIGTSGRTTITGNYAQTSGALAVDIGGTNQATAFQNSTGYYDFVNVSGTVALAGALNVGLTGGFTPTSGNSFTVMSYANTASPGTFSNLVAGNRVFATDLLNTFAVTTGSTSVVLNGFLTNEWKSASGSTWSPDANWTVLSPGSGALTGYVAKFGTSGAASAAGTVDVDAAQTVSGMIFSNANAYTLSGTGSITLQGSGTSAATVSVVSGSHSIAVPMTLASNAIVSGSANSQLTLGDVSGASQTLTKTGPGTLIIGGTATIAGLNANGGTTQLNNNTTLQSISIGAGATLALSANNVNSAKVIDTSALSITTGGTLDLWDNALILRDQTAGTNQSANLAAVQSLVNTAFDNGAWDKPGITSSSVIADLGAYSVLTVMVYDNTVLGIDSFEGINNLTVDNGGNQVMLKTTYLGDFDGNGIVNSADYGWLDFYYGYGLTVGDLNGDGQVNSADYNGIDYGYGYQAYGVLAGGGQSVPSATVASAAAPASPEAVPEPGTLGMLLVGALGLFGRRTRKQSSRQ